MAKVTLLFDRFAMKRRWRVGENAFETYAGEILKYAGIPFTVADNVHQAVNGKPDVLIAGVVDDSSRTVDLLLNYAQNGGALISYGGLNAMAGKLGFVRMADIGAGYARA
jgi:hypothetical protein